MATEKNDGVFYPEIANHDGMGVHMVEVFCGCGTNGRNVFGSRLDARAPNCLNCGHTIQLTGKCLTCDGEDPRAGSEMGDEELKRLGLTKYLKK